MHLKPILAGEVVVDSRESRLYRFVREHYNDAVAVEMEGAGLATAAHASGAVPSMVVRGISDLAGGGKAASDAAGWQEQAAAHAAAFAVQLLVTLDPKAFPRPPRRKGNRPIRWCPLIPRRIARLDPLGTPIRDDAKESRIHRSFLENGR